MKRVRIILPATITHLGTIIGGIGLAVNLHLTVDVRQRRDDRILLELNGEQPPKPYATEYHHPIVIGMSTFFQHVESALSGFQIRVDNNIPYDVGLNTTAVQTLAGVIAAANLLHIPFKRDELLQITATAIGRADSMVASMLGGLVAAHWNEQTHRLHYHQLATPDLKFILVHPDVKKYTTKAIKILSKSLNSTLIHESYNRIPLLLHALQTSDYALLESVMDDPIWASELQTHIPAYRQIAETVKKLEGTNIIILDGGPTLLIVARRHHEVLATEITRIFKQHSVEARSWILGIDRQGIVLSMMQSS